MRFAQIIRLSAIHVAVALTLLPIDSTLNRIMISELGIPASLVALLIAVPYVLSPMQMWIGALGERYPLWGWRRSPYIVLGLVLFVPLLVLLMLVALLLVLLLLVPLLLVPLLLGVCPP